MSDKKMKHPLLFCFVFFQLMEKMVWIEVKTTHNISLNQSWVQIQALILFSSMKFEKGKEAAEENFDKFEASRSWFMSRKGAFPKKAQDKAASANVEAEATYPEVLTKRVHESDYIKQQCIWKSLLLEDDTITRKKSIFGFNISKGKQTLLVGADAACDFKLKPVLIYHSENSRALKNYAKCYQTTWPDKHFQVFSIWFKHSFRICKQTSKIQHFYTSHISHINMVHICKG